jgi:hypothetical protein
VIEILKDVKVFLKFVDVPNCPSAPARLAIVDGRISNKIEKLLLKQGIQLIKTLKLPGLLDAVSYHPDIMFHHIGGNRIVHAPEVDIYILKELENSGFYLIQGSTKLTGSYPGDISYNGARVGNFFFHNLKYTDKVLLNELYDAGVELVNVNQGYTKCSVAVINENSIITADTNIAKEAERRDIKVLLIPPQRDIILPGLDYGFIGGCSGLIGKGSWAIFGKAEKLPSFFQIQEFLKKENCQILSLSDDEVIDLGTLLTVKT